MTWTLAVVYMAHTPDLVPMGSKPGAHNMPSTQDQYFDKGENFSEWINESINYVIIRRR